MSDAKLPERGDDAWKMLVAKYADGRPICNCGGAYYTPCGEGYLNGERRNDLLACRWGCSSNLIAAKNEIALRILADFADCAAAIRSAKLPG